MTSQQRLLDDLAWCLASPPLIRSDDDPVTWPPDAWFRRLATGDVDTLPSPPDTHRFRLGGHFEKLLETWIDARDDMRVNQMNLQVRRGKRTVGEFDFLIDTDSTTEHWEAAIKFYLGVDDRRRLSAWYGPNTSDRFDRKLARLIEHQLTLSRQEAAQPALATLGIHVARVMCFMKGRLFHPWADFHRGTFECPDAVNPDHEKGWWLARSDFDDAAPRERRYVYLPKVHWLAPIKARHGLASLSFEQTCALLDAPGSEQATHLAILDDSGDEVSRGFVVKPRWLARAVPEE